MSTTELYFHTREQLAERIDVGLELCRERDLDSAATAALLPQIVQLLSQKQITQTVPAPALLPAAPLLGGRRH